MYLEHDRNGNVTLQEPRGGAAGRRIELAHDALNRPVRAEVSETGEPGLTARYAHDALGRRIGKTIERGPASATETLFHDGEQVTEERRADGRVTLRLYGGLALDDLVMQVTGAERLHVVTDGQGSVVRVLDGAGELVARYSYDDYGLPRSSRSDGEPPAEAREPIAGVKQLFTGAWHDEETGLYWMRTRLMSPTLGRFMERDPAGLWADGAALGNGYTYAANNPGTLRDPLGLKAAPGMDSTPDAGWWGRDKYGPAWCVVCADPKGGDQAETTATSARPKVTLEAAERRRPVRCREGPRDRVGSA